MRVQSYTEMLCEYGMAELEEEDLRDRLLMLSTQPYSVIVEAEHMELDGLCDWIKMNLGANEVNWLHYGKTGYDFGFAEFFFEQENDAQTVAGAVPRMYTIYPHSSTPDKAIKSMGYNHSLQCNPEDEQAIVFYPKNSLSK